MLAYRRSGVFLFHRGPTMVMKFSSCIKALRTWIVYVFHSCARNLLYIYIHTHEFEGYGCVVVMRAIGMGMEGAYCRKMMHFQHGRKLR